MMNIPLKNKTHKLHKYKEESRHKTYLKYLKGYLLSICSNI